MSAATSGQTNFIGCWPEQRFWKGKPLKTGRVTSEVLRQDRNRIILGDISGKTTSLARGATVAALLEPDRRTNPDAARNLKETQECDIVFTPCSFRQVAP